LDAIDLSLAANRPVYVHCFGGMGRTGSAICCWLQRHGLVSPKNVLGVLTQLRQADVERASWKAPENETQENFVLSWTKKQNS
ncbi:MAG: protein-tyrosine phosphatase family protein, partial [Rubripirellula sp.]